MNFHARYVQYLYTNLMNFHARYVQYLYTTNGNLVTHIFNNTLKKYLSTVFKTIFEDNTCMYILLEL